MSLYTEDVGTKLFCVISFFPFICAGMLSPSMAACWEQLGRRGGLKQSGFIPGNGNAWIHQFCPKPLPPGSTVCCVCCEQGEDLFSQNLLLTASASFRRDLHKTEQQPLPFIKLCTAASATDLRSFLELGIPLMDIPASPFQAPCVLKDSHFN